MIDAAHARSDEHLEAPPPDATAVVRAELSRGLGVELARLAPIDMRRRIAELFTFGGGYALGTGNSVANYIPLANYLAMLDEGRSYGVYR